MDAVSPRMKLLFLAVLLLASGLPGRVHHQPERATRAPKMHLPFYRITHPGSRDTSYLFGTLHLLESSYVDTLPAVMAALGRSDLVIGELVLDSGLTGDALSGLFDAPPLDSLLTPHEYEDVSAAVKKYSPVPLLVLNHAEPIVIYTMVMEGMYAKKHPENQTTGIPMDLYFQQKARESNIPIKAFEQASDQEQALDSIPIKEQIEELTDLVRHPKSTLADMDRMLSDYRSGRISKILSDPSFGTLSPGEMSSLIYSRNQKWIASLLSILKLHHAFIAVGAGHLPGKYGLIAGLRKRGYSISWVPAN